MYNKIHNCLMLMIVLLGCFFVAPSYGDPESPYMLSSGDVSAFLNLGEVQLGGYNYDGVFVGCAISSDLEGDIEIPDMLTAFDYPPAFILYGAFGWCDKITSITIPSDGLERIEGTAFVGCSSLKAVYLRGDNEHYSTTNGLIVTADYKTLVAGFNGDVVIPDCVKHIESGAFAERPSLTSLVLPDTLEDTYLYEIEKCSSLTNVVIPSSVKRIEGFPDCDSLENLLFIPDTVTEIEDGAFRDCDSLRNVVIPAGVTHISAKMFLGCDSITNVVIHDKVVSIGDYAFSGCSKLSNIEIPDSVTRIGEGAFAECDSLTSIVLPLGEVNKSAFSNCDSLTNVVFMGSVVSDYTFESCKKLESITFSENLLSIGEFAFGGCDSLSKIKIPENVKNVASSAFLGCKNLSQFEVDQNNSAVFMRDGVLYGDNGSRLISVFTNATNISILEKVAEIEGYAFYGCRDLESLSIPIGVKTIKTTPFEVKLGAIQQSYEWIYDGVDKDGYGVWRCTPYAYGSWGYEAGRYYHGPKLTMTFLGPRRIWVNFKKDFPETQLRGFDEGVYNLQAGKVDVEWQTFYRGELGMPPSWGPYPYNPFPLLHCEVKVKAENVVFKNCTSLRKLEIPASMLSEFSQLMPDSYTNLTTVILKGDEECSIPEEAFRGCLSLERVGISSGVTNIRSRAFSECESLKAICFFGNAPSVSADIFESSSLPTVYVQYGSTGWDGVPGSTQLPDKWHGCDIKYLPSLNSYAGVYDGLSHGVTVGGLTNQGEIEVEYSTCENGPYSKTPIVYTDAGEYIVWCRINPLSDIIKNQKKVAISPRAVTLTSGSASKAFDGTALINNNVTVGGDGFVGGEGASYNVTGSQTNVGESENAFTYTLNDGTKASNYNITTVNGKLTVIKANVGGGTNGGEEPGNGEVPQGGVSKFDASCVYDGKGHTINTNALVAAFGSAMVGASVIEYAVDDGSVSGGVGHAALPWDTTAPVYTNAGEYIVWYRVTNPNYEDFTHAAKLSIAKRDATLTSGSSSWIYDGVAHSNTAVTATGFVDGEGVTTNNFPSIENIGSVANAFDYAFIDGTLAENYNVTCVTGTLSVVSAQMDEWTDESKWAVTLSGNDAKYDGTEKICEVAAIAYDGFSIPTYTVTGNKGTDAGNYTLTVAGSGNFSGSHTFNWSIAKRAVTLTSGSASKVYDGTALINNNVTVEGDGFVDGEGASYNVTGSQTNVGESENTFSYTLNDGTKASNYNITTANGTLTVTKANVGGGTDGGEEPGDGEVPQGGVSKFDASFVYDGEGHTINTNALTAAFGSAMVGASAIEYAIDDGSVSGGVGHAALPWDATAPVYTNAGEYIIWYRVTNPNYNEFTHAAKVTITPRTGVVVDIVGNVATNVYSGAAQSVDGYTVAINDSLYKETDFEFTGNSAVSGTAAGKYPMGLLASQFSNKNENFTDVTFNVTDGELVILGSLQKSVILDAIGGTFADGTVVTQECEDVYLAFPVATREGYVFDGWYLGVTNGAPKATVGAELLVDDDHTLFAKWKIDETLMPGGESIFTWEAIDANTARITGFKNPEQKLTTLALPDTIDGKAVVEIADGAFANSRSGMTRILLSMYCVKIGYAAFTGVSTLTDIVFSDVHKWQTPDVGTTLSIGAYAFSGVGVSTVTLPATVGSIGDYAFANCAKLSSITILGRPAVGMKPLRRAGTGVGGVTVHLDPALASDNAYMNALKQECLNVTVRADAVVKRMKLSSLSMARNFIVLSVSVEKAAAWGKVDLSAIKVAYRKTLSEEPYMLAPSAIVENPDGSLSVEVPVPAGDSGFFQVVFQK